MNLEDVQKTDGGASSGIRVGIAGWSYADWTGFVYPRGVRDKLRYVAPFFDVIEINSTFYRPPDARTTHSWLKRTADLSAFRFTAKLHQNITHKSSHDPALTRQIIRGLQPLAEAGRLSHLLAQFRYDFADGDETRSHLQWIQVQFGSAMRLALELRHRSWQSSSALEFLSNLSVNVVVMDYPLAGNSFNRYASGVGEHAYLRLHGRNASAWFSREAGRDQVYNYLYSEEELDHIAARALTIAGMSKSLTLIANNHYQGKEVANALEIKARVTGQRVDIPAPLLKQYPRLKRIARHAPQELPLFNNDTP